MNLFYHGFGPYADMLGGHPWLVGLLLLWTLPLKGYALWKAAHREDNIWFVALFLVNSLGILELIYIFLVAKKLDHKVIVEPRP